MRISDWGSDVCSSDLHAPLRRTARLRRGGEGPPVGLGSPQARPWQPAVRGPARSSWHHPDRSEEHTSELQSLMRISYAVFCLKKTKQTPNNTNDQHSGE